MNLLENLKEQLKAARKAQQNHVVTALSTLIGEIELGLRRAPSFASNDKFVNGIVGSTVKKFLDGLEVLEQETLKNWKIGDDQNLQTVAEDRALYLEIQERYKATLPQQLTDEQIIKIVVDSGAANMGQAMGILKKSHAGAFDGARASALIKSHFENAQ